VARVLFLPDTPVDQPGDCFRALVARLGLEDFALEGEEAGAACVAFVGTRRAEERFGRGVKCGRVPGAGEFWVLPSTARERRGTFYEGVWREFAGHVLGRDLAVRDEYRGMAPGEIREALAARRFPFGVLLVNLVYDFNVASVIRNANAFLAREVCLFGRRRVDTHGAMGTQRYETLVHLPDEAALDRHIAEQSYALVCFEETPDARPLPAFVWPERPLMAFGQEGAGLPPSLLSRAAARVFIPQHGSIRSLNLAVAAGIAMYSWHTARLPV